MLLALLCCPGAVADLHDAILSGDLDRVRQEITGGANVNQPDQMGATPLHDVAWSGNLEIARFLLDHGASVKARHAEGGSQPLAYACIIPNPQLKLQFREQSFKPARMPARFHPYAHFPSLPRKIAIELFRFLTVLQSPLLEFPGLAIQKSNLLEARVIIASLYLVCICPSRFLCVSGGLDRDSAGGRSHR